VIRNKPSFNKKKWLRNHLDDVLRLKKEGLTHQYIIQMLKKEQNMPFDLDESLLSRYLKEFAENKSTTLKTKTALTNKVERQNDRLSRQNNEIQNLKRRLDRMAEREIRMQIESKNLKERNQVLENKFLDGDARIVELLRYKGLHNSKWKIADLEQKNDDLFQTVLMLERRVEKAEVPLEQAHEKIAQLGSELSQIKQEYEQLEQTQIQSNQKNKQLEINIYALKLKLAQKETPVIDQDQEKIEELTHERQKFLQERNQLHMLSKRLKSDLNNSEHQLNEISNLLNESRNNAKKKDFWQVLALSFCCLAVIFFLMFIVI
jgi:chromosome segregation ATPase